MHSPAVIKFMLSHVISKRILVLNSSQNQLSRLAGLLTSFILEILAPNAHVTYIAFQDYNINVDINHFFDFSNG